MANHQQRLQAQANMTKAMGWVRAASGREAAAAKASLIERLIERGWSRMDAEYIARTGRRPDKAA